MHNHRNGTPELVRGTVTDAAHSPLPEVSWPAEMGTIADTRARFGIPRSTLYRLASAGHVRMVKLGRTTLVDFASVRAFLGNAPTVTLRAPKDVA